MSEWIPLWVQVLAGVAVIGVCVIWFFAVGVSWLEAAHRVGVIKSERWVARVREESDPDVLKLRRRVAELEAELEAAKKRVAEMGGHRG